MRKKNSGFTLVEVIVVVAVLGILLGMLIPSVNPLLGFQAQKATGEIAAALDKTRIEAMSRLVGEMKLEKRADGVYVTYHLYRGRQHEMTQEEDKIGGRQVIVKYVLDEGSEQELAAGNSLIITYDRDTGGFLPVQSRLITKDEAEADDQDPPFDNMGSYCTSIIVTAGMRTREISLEVESGKYTIQAR